MRKIFLALSLVFAMCLSACGKSIGTSSSSDSETSVDSSKDIVYQINFDLNGGTSESYKGSVVVDTFTKDVFFFDCVKKDYNFRGWSYEGTKIFDEKGFQLANPTMAESMTFVAIYAQTAKMNIEINIEGAGSVTGEGEYPYNTYVDVTATPNKGYSFVGWYYENTVLSNQQEYKYMMWSEDVTLEARFEINYYDLHVASVHPELGSVMIKGDLYYEEESTQSVQYLKQISIAAYTKTEEYRFLGWYDTNGELVTTNAAYSFVMVNYDYDLYAKWDAPSFDVTVTKNYENGGTVTGAGMYEYNSIVSLEATTNSGYEFDGWYDNTTKLSFESTYSFNMPYESITYKAVWSAVTYNITYELNGGTNSSSNPSTYTVEDIVTLADPSKTGYSFAGWTLNNNPISTIEAGTFGNLTLVATWSINSYNVTVISSDESKGTVSGSGTYEYNSEVTVVATPNNGYRFSGWYNGTTKKSSNSSYTFAMPASDISLTAQWTPITYNITYELDGGINSSFNPSTYTVEDMVTLADPSKTGYSFAGWTLNGKPISTIPAGTIGNLTLVATWSINSYDVTATSSDTSKGTVSGSGTYEYNSEVTVVATPTTDCIFKGWYSDSELTTKVSSDASYSFTMPAYDLSLYAKFWTQAEEEEDIWNKNHGVIPVVDDVNSQVTYGLYPQTIVDDSDLLTVLNSLDDTYINSDNDWYFYNDEYYAKLTASPCSTNYVFNNGDTIIGGATYWFLCEPITWDILSNSNGQYYLLSDVLLDAHCYHTSIDERIVNNSVIYPNNYQYSDIRAWINGYDGSSYSVSDYRNAGFLDIAFALNSSYIQTTTVDNSASTTAESSNSYACSNTNDKIFLPSYQDYKNSSYGFPTRSSSSGPDVRCCLTTDYARARGASYSSITSDVLYNGYSWTRSPDDTPRSVSYVNEYGWINGCQFPTNSTCGVRPSLNLLIS